MSSIVYFHQTDVAYLSGQPRRRSIEKKPVGAFDVSRARDKREPDNLVNRTIPELDVIA